MTFYAEPFSKASIVFNGDATYELRCDSCGGGHKYTFHEDSTLYQFQEKYYEHLKLSHELVPKCGFVMNVKDFTIRSLQVNGFLKCTLDINHKGNHHLEMVNQ